jgi:dienelactone hydrolase
MTRPRFIVDQDECLLDDPAAVHLAGLDPHATVSVFARVGPRNAPWAQSCADFRADGAGEVWPTRHAPLSGTYSGVDPFGLWWSMRRLDEREHPRRAVDGLVTTLDAVVDGTPVSSLTLHRRRVARSVTRTRVDDDGIVGVLFTPADAAPSVLVLGGSGGGLRAAEALAASLASRGFVALALAYFGLPGLPRRLVEVPIEYGVRAIRRLQHVHRVSGRGVGIVGRSRGGEYALLLASRTPDVRAVVGLCASPFMWQALDPRATHARAAWSEHGVPLPFMVPSVQGAQAVHFPGSAEPETATIPIERIDGAVLLASGDDDGLWPATPLAQIAMQRLDKSGHRARFADEHLRYAGAGHAIGFPPGLPDPPTAQFHPVTRQMHQLGGTRAANAAANADLWPRMLEFLRARLQ